MPMNLPEISEDDGATVKYHDYTDTKNSSSIAVAFVASYLFCFADRSCFFFGDCRWSFSPLSEISNIELSLIVTFDISLSSGI
jgi:hypothetical protein